MFTAMFVLAVIAITLFALSATAFFVRPKGSPAVPGTAALAVLVLVALAVLVIVGQFVGV